MPYVTARTTTHAPAWRLFLTALVGLLLVFAAIEAALVIPPAASRPGVTLGLDYVIYQERTASWLSGQGFYQPYQLAGPYEVEAMRPYAAMYPPVLLAITVPFAIGLPAVLWWAIPLGIIAFAIHRARPPLWAWVVLAAILVYPRTWAILVYGNPTLWVMAFIAAGAVWRWPLAFVPLKPTLAIALVLGVRHKSFWWATGLAIVVACFFGTSWFDYATALANARSSAGLAYPFGDVPIALALLVALARSPLE
jgi:hypothetical protein